MNRELEIMIMTASDLPTIPVVATKVMQLIESEKATAEELAKVVASDPAVAARVLKISNSSFYGCQRQIQTLSHAIVVLGFSTLKSLVVAASVKQVYKPYGLTEKMLWEHSFGAGLAARIIAKETRAANEEEAFLGGLFHDIGKIIMNNMDSQQFQAAMQKCYNDQVSFSEAERQVYSYTHSEVGALVIKKWNFPDILMHAVLKHHSFDFAEDEDAYQIRLACVVGLANMFCHKAGVGMREPDDDLELLETVPAQLLGIDQQKMEILLESFNAAYEKDKSYFG
ncbi:MAG: HD family phosphohydrolase [Geobacteraceae bacterium GWC2_55_20]|nr:MAG: HD family phosphohydrolase [Geobacteraceae bacterium GWC2_55_20]OGU25318.1 MAG: HD family phosphohydrolase [Geobacteraceae bacterium GWF2_54_21]HBA72544.1 HD family phosphohydrolase [Geobacter sp.]HCE66485.1 HD family phosphohydrolase [Geobacter sp.]